jgi:hypothetical protein
LEQLRLLVRRALTPAADALRGARARPSRPRRRLPLQVHAESRDGIRRAWLATAEGVALADEDGALPLDDACRLAHAANLHAALADAIRDLLTRRSPAAVRRARDLLGQAEEGSPECVEVSWRPAAIGRRPT